MKTWLTNMVVLVALGSVYAQADNMVIEEKSLLNPNETQFTTEILGLGEDFVLSHWQNYLEEHGGTSEFQQNERGNFRMYTNHVKFPPLGNESVTIKTLMAPNEAETGVDLSIGVIMADGTSVSSKNQSKSEMELLKNWLMEFNGRLRTLEKDEVFDPVEVQANNNNT